MVIGKVLKWAIYLVIGYLVFGLVAIFFTTALIPVFITIFTVLMIVSFFKFSKLLLKGAALLLVIYLALTFIPFQECYGAGENRVQECDCYGLEKTISLDDYTYSECIGYPTNYECYTFENQTKQLIECEN